MRQWELPRLTSLPSKLCRSTIGTAWVVIGNAQPTSTRPVSPSLANLGKRTSGIVHSNEHYIPRPPELKDSWSQCYMVAHLSMSKKHPLPFTMQRKASENKQGPSESEDCSFEEKMHSAFWRGVRMLKDAESDGRQCQESLEESLGTSTGTEVINEVLKNVTFLEPVIGKLIGKVSCRVILSAPPNAMQYPPRTPSAEWLSKAQESAQWLQQHELRRKQKLEALLQYLDADMSWVEFLIRENDNEEV
ncbi:hypothetical protein EI94DRAFT_1703477 [Lactarius quietus]|nr:hypothetical protein EI94DRAFT_1703477 [Lactarius quietus]